MLMLETFSLSKILEAVKLLGKAGPNSEKILEEAEKELGLGNKKKRETGEIKFTVPPHDLRTWLDMVRRQGVKPKTGIHYREINGKTEVIRPQKLYEYGFELYTKYSIKILCPKDHRQRVPLRGFWGVLLTPTFSSLKKVLLNNVMSPVDLIPQSPCP
jgi:hypothetical protein